MKDTMQGAVLRRYAEPSALEVNTIPQPTLHAGEVLVKVHASSVNDWDWALVRGSPFYIRLLCGFLRPNVRIPGTDVAGVVVAVGAGVTRFVRGDRVYGDLSEAGFGAFAQYVCVPESAIALQPAGLTHAQAAALPHAGLLALQSIALYQKDVRGKTVLVNGAGGGMGSLSVQLLRHAGAARVVGVDHGSKRALLLHLGCDTALDYTQQDFTLRGEHFDLVIDAKSTRSPWHYLRALAPDGCYITVGGAPGKLLLLALLAPLLRRVNSKRLKILALKPNQGLATLSDYCQQGALTPVLGDRYPLERCAQALTLFGSGLHQGKVIIDIVPEAPLAS